MITQQDAETLAQQTMQRYVAECKCDNTQDVANVLMKLASMCGLGMCATVGQDDAVARLQGITEYIRDTPAGKNWRCEKAN